MSDIKSIAQRHPFPWRVVEPPYQDCPVIVDANDEEVVGVSEWLRADDDVIGLLVEAVNQMAANLLAQ